MRAAPAVATLLLAVATPLLAAQPTTPFPGEGNAYRDCRCLANGQRYRIGERICLDGRILECGRVLNNTAWLRSQQRCEPVA